jgi:predicted ribosomally synthesized peptide with SipW-like signal peptide
MKRILLSLGLIVAVAGVVAGGTIAFYNDTETSTGNIFTAGSIDLKVDHLKQSYNGEDCTTLCDNWAAEVTSFNQGDRKDGSDVVAGRSDPNQALGPNNTSGGTPDPSPTGFVSLGFGGSIVLHFPDGIDDKAGDDIRIYEATGATSPAYPNELISVEVSPNGFDWVTVDVNPLSITFDGTVEIDLDGVAPVVYYVRITDISDPNLHSSTADGYDLDAVKAIHCEDPENDGVQSNTWQCQLWEERDLNGQTFFNFNDIKPADYGRNVISLHVFDNDAYTCLIVHDKDDQENTLLDPETDMGDAPNTGNLNGFGELSNYLDIFAWNDLDADGVYEPNATIPETSIYEGDIQTEIIQMSLSSGSTGYIGLAWCAGNIQVNHGNGVIGCDGNGMLNNAQSDSFGASLTAYAEQQRNNPNFSCANVVLTQ